MNVKSILTADIPSEQQEGLIHHAGTEVLLLEEIGPDVWLVEVRIADESLEGDAWYEVLEVSSGELKPHRRAARMSEDAATPLTWIFHDGMWSLEVPPGYEATVDGRYWHRHVGDNSKDLRVAISACSDPSGILIHCRKARS